MKKDYNYEPPQIEVIEVEVEMGFANSIQAPVYESDVW